jgi:pimeloyl-ACP methyl ester carboxylesterase
LSSDLTKSLTADLLLGALEAWVDVAIPHEKFFLVGNSMGGGLCLLFSFAHPEKVRRLIVASPVGGFEKEADWNEFQKDFHFDSWLDSKRYLEKVFHTKPLYLPLFYLPFLKAMNRKGVKQLMASAQFEDFLLTDTARKELPPTLFIWGQEEALFTSRNLAQFKKTLPAHVIYEEPADIGHCPQLNDPEWFKSRILDFIRL